MSFKARLEREFDFETVGALLAAADLTDTARSYSVRPGADSNGTSPAEWLQRQLPPPLSFKWKMRVRTIAALNTLWRARRDACLDYLQAHPVAPSSPALDAILAEFRPPVLPLRVRNRHVASPSRVQKIGGGIEHLRVMFPDADQQALQAVLEMSNNDVAAATHFLLG